MTYERFDVVVVPFPFSERRATKRRPALVVSKAEFNRSHRHLVLAMITSSAHERWPSDVAISDLGEAGLGAPSLVRLKLFTLDRALVRRRIGALGAKDRSLVASMLETHIG